ncbi:esterase-like activity of phytase family protein [Pseudomonas sp. DTU_2021_1001937_2_SI_NGA_ILE_001]|uniref:esterase-like activity of phytase family protein n=1 Tax=Pseudomonas sp. DTU_2021_1001937_2_SI_NGA_ILE_001 TaxID=3077589 RepID=UPI0028FC1E2A|nr:esterase-like activity of phytase family protein [Pseudomonas sp. DTU_2021_1001937_2_SI_NGA_ILE_001]WNW13102.1 esterase-like activity of phytase family protein [Pseudomonas sp. DTU_2021_1001937_2_SI_NGA_ILE_001]
MRAVWLALLVLLAVPAYARVPLQQLKLVSEHPVDGMSGGNLSGLAACNGVLWTVSDRDDLVLYRLERSQRVWQAEAVSIEVPQPPSDLPVSLRSLASLSAVVRGGGMDYEGISCDAQGNRYVVSEAHGAVLKVPVQGVPTWLPLPAQVIQQAREKGMLQRFNALYEGIAISPDGEQLWLAAEREQRGLLQVRFKDGQWQCPDSCVLYHEAGVTPDKNRPLPDFSDVSLFNGKLFTLERSVYRVCRRSLDDGQIERCWSFANEARKPERLYDQPYGLTEALVVDETGAWIGTDNNFGARADGEKRPVVWRFAAPTGGWSAP